MFTRISRYCEGVMEAGWLAAVILTPIFFNVYSSRIFEPDKIAILRSLAWIILAAWIVKLVDTSQTQWEKVKPDQGILKSILRIPLIIPVVLFTGVYLLSTIFSVTQRVSLWGSYQRLQGTYTTFSYLIIFAALLGNLRRRDQVERLVTTMILSSLPVSLYGFLQHYKIDPIPWGGDVSRRIASNLGNSIFVAAYLIMVFPLTVGRMVESMRTGWQETRWLSIHIARLTIYVFIATVQIVAIYMSGSRGPVLGLLVGTFVLFLLLSWLWKKRWLTSAVIGFACLGIVFLGVFNLPNSPLEGLRRSPAIGRFGLLLDAESNSALVRRYIWEGTVALVSPHEPLRYPDGRQDQLNFLRPLIGYGPESMYVAFNPFYVPELGQVERRNASPDRAHNETWDAMVITGFLGLIAYLSVFLLVFYYSLRWIGLINGSLQQKQFWGLCITGGIAGSVLLILWRGVEYFGLGLPLGLVGGLVIYIVYAIYVNPIVEILSERKIIYILQLIVLLVGILSHFLEINFGIAIAATRTHFWTYTALIILVGYVFPKAAETEQEPSIHSAEKESAQRIKITQSLSSSKVDSRSSRSRRQRKGEWSTRSTEYKLPGWLQIAFPEAGIAGIFMFTLGYNYISNSSRITSLFDVLWNSLVRLPNQENAVSLGILALISTTWLAAGALLVAERIRPDAPLTAGQPAKQSDLESHLTRIKDDAQPNYIRMLVVTLVFSATIGLVFWIWHATTLINLVKFVPENIEQLMIQLGRVGSLLTNYYIYLIIILLVLAYFLSVNWPSRKSGTTFITTLVTLILVIASFWVIYISNLRVIHADIAFKMAEPFNRPDQWPIATQLYLFTNSLAPDQDHYYLFLGRSYLEQAKGERNAERQDQLVREAEQELKVAQRKNPLNTDHTANLGRLYSWWASKALDPQDRKERGEIASRYYASALTLSPQNSTLWGEWALLYLDVLDNPEEAFTRLQHALELDTHYHWTLGLMGDYYSRMGHIYTDTIQKFQSLEKALGYYEQAWEVSDREDAQTQVGYLVAIGNVYVELGKYDEAVLAYQKALDLGPSSTNLWRIEETLARIYLLMDDIPNAILHANAALAAAPEEQIERISQWIDEINSSTH